MMSDYATMIGVVSGITLIPLLLLLARDQWGNNTWGRIGKPVTLREVFRDWIAYVLIFLLFSLVLREILCRLCSYCEAC